MYKASEVEKAALEYFKGDSLAANVWIDKYALKKDGEYLELTPDDMYKRLAKEFARIEEKYPNSISYEEIYNLLKEQIILPGGSLLYGIGNKHSISSLGNCFVIGNKSDSYGGICTTDQEQAQLMKRRAGVGHDISHLRPANSKVTNAAGTSTGASSFMHRYSNTTREVAQNGRRGALMLTCNINHPDSTDFIKSKSDKTKITGANISVKVDDKFMEIIDNGFCGAFPKRNPFDLWKELTHQAWDNAEPGVLFWDTIKRESIPSCYGTDWQEVSTNPCGEIPLCPYDSCRLLSINLTKIVNNPFTGKAKINWGKLKDYAYKAQKLMDDVVDLEEEKINKILEKIENDPEPEEIKAIEKNLWIKIKSKLLEGRRTGLSGIGLADTLAACNISYFNGITLAEEIYKQLAISAYKSSIDMAKDRGAFPIWDVRLEIDQPFLNRVYSELNWSFEEFESYGKYGRRNISLLTIPPSGSISLLAGISSGIEPVYQLSYKRRRKVDKGHPNVSFTDKNGDCWEEYEVLHPKFKEWMITTHKSIDWSNTSRYVQSLNKDEEFVNKLFDTLTEEGLELSKKTSPYNNSTSYELNPLDRVKMQGAIQKWVDHSISSTINLPQSATEWDVNNIYLTAWKEGLKGVTIYREGSRDGVLISNEDKKEVFNQTTAPKRPKVLRGQVFTPTTHGNDYIVVVGLYDDKPYEVFAAKNSWNLKGSWECDIIKKARGKYDVNIKDKLYIEDVTSEMSQIEEDRTRLISVSLRHGADIKFLVEQLNKAKGNGFQDFSKVVARTLKRYIKDNDKVTGATCENCGSTDLIYKDGCVECSSCGSSKCG